MSDNQRNDNRIKSVMGSEDDDKNRVLSIVATISVIIIIVALLVLTLWNMLNLVLLTFLVTFLFYHLQRLTKKRIISRFNLRIPDGLLLFLLYILVIAFITLLSISFIPNLVSQITELARVLTNFNINSVREAIDPRLANFLGRIDLTPYISNLGNILMDSVTLIGVFGFQFILAFLLSFMILLEKGKIYMFGESLKSSKINFVYEYIMQFGGSFVDTFGKVMKVQVTISFINCILSMIILAILGFPSVIGFGVMLFFLGLVPVAGVIISLVPLSIVGYVTGGFKMVLAVLIMILVIHAIEAYVLNPKLMATRTSLPICFVFIILLVAQHYLGVWGLLIGVPLFIFLMKTFDVNYQENIKPKPIFNRERFKKFRGKKSETEGTTDE